MRALKMGLRAWKDLYDQIWWMLLYLILWWFLTVTVVFGPPAMLLLFHVADPRVGVWGDRLTLREVVQFLLSNFGRGWKVWLATVPIVALCVFNLTFYGGSDHAIAVLTPIWLALVVMAIVATIVIFACAGILGMSARESFKTGFKVTASRAPQLVLILLVTLFLPFIMFAWIITIAYPLTFVIPGVTALAMGRLVLDALGQEYPRPNEPTEELLREKRTS